MRTLVLVLAIGCGADYVAVPPDAVLLETNGRADARAGLPDDGFGFSCRKPEFDGTINTACFPSSGINGVCMLGVCRRVCPGDFPNHRCPTGQVGQPIVGPARCVCIPRECSDTFRRNGDLPAYCRAVDFGG